MELNKSLLTKNSIKLRLILVQISEAHTKKWPLGMVDHPDQHSSFEEKVKRANYFNSTYKGFEVFVDSFENEFENELQAWPDQYYLIDSSFTIKAKSEYGMNAVIIEDYTSIIEKIINL